MLAAVGNYENTNHSNSNYVEKLVILLKCKLLTWAPGRSLNIKCIFEHTLFYLASPTTISTNTLLQRPFNALHPANPISMNSCFNDFLKSPYIHLL
jgi:hypothetical protein